MKESSELASIASRGFLRSMQARCGQRECEDLAKAGSGIERAVKGMAKPRQPSWRVTYGVQTFLFGLFCVSQPSTSVFAVEERCMKARIAPSELAGWQMLGVILVLSLNLIFGACARCTPRSQNQ
jgi:hypothetical protein